MTAQAALWNARKDLSIVDLRQANILKVCFQHHPDNFNFYLGLTRNDDSLSDDDLRNLFACLEDIFDRNRLLFLVSADKTSPFPISKLISVYKECLDYFDLDYFEPPALQNVVSHILSHLRTSHPQLNAELIRSTLGDSALLIVLQRCAKELEQSQNSQ